MGRWAENPALFKEGNTKACSAYAIARDTLPVTPHFLNPRDNLFSHSIRVASKIHELIGDPERQDTMAAAALYLEIPSAIKERVNNVGPHPTDYGIWFPLWCYNLDLKGYPDHAHIAEVTDRKMKTVENGGMGDQLQGESLFILMANELDHLNSHLDFYQDASQMYGSFGKEVFMGSLPYSYGDHIRVHESLIAEVQKLKSKIDLPWEGLLSEYSHQLDFFKSISPELQTEIHTDDVALRSQIRLITAGKISKSGISGLSVIAGGELALERGIPDGQLPKNIDMIELNAILDDGTQAHINVNQQNEWTSRWMIDIFEYCQKNNIVWHGPLRFNTFENKKKELLQDLKVVTTKEFADTFNFDLENENEVFSKFVTYTLAIGDISNTPIVTPYRVALAEKETPLSIAQSVEEVGEIKNPKDRLVTDSHLYLPYVFERVKDLLKQTGLYSREGLEALAMSALENKSAWMSKEIIEHVHTHTPTGIFKSQMEANEFLMYIADTFRESLGKSTATSHLLSNDFIKKFIDIYQADPDRQREVIESVREWHERNKPFHLQAVRSRMGDEAEAQKLEYFDELIIASFS
jgi:hypothetical protein